jgi:hypothetical protein
MYENEKRQYANTVLDVEQGTFPPLIFTTTSGMGRECMQYCHRRLAELTAHSKHGLLD